jgi:hypothetical protein
MTDQERKNLMDLMKMKWKLKRDLLNLTKDIKGVKKILEEIDKIDTRLGLLK